MPGGVPPPVPPGKPATVIVTTRKGDDVKRRQDKKKREKEKSKRTKRSKDATPGTEGADAEKSKEKRRHKRKKEGETGATEGTGEKRERRRKDKSAKSTDSGEASPTTDSPREEDSFAPPSGAIPNAKPTKGAPAAPSPVTSPRDDDAESSDEFDDLDADELAEMEKFLARFGVSALPGDGGTMYRATLLLRQAESSGQVSADVVKQNLEKRARAGSMELDDLESMLKQFGSLPNEAGYRGTTLIQGMSEDDPNAIDPDSINIDDL